MKKDDEDKNDDGSAINQYAAESLTQKILTLTNTLVSELATVRDR